MEEDGASHEAQSKAYDDIDQAFHQDSAFADYDPEEEEHMRLTNDFNDQVVHSGNKLVEMNLFYMCTMRDMNNYYDPNAKCGLYTSGKLWNRRGAAPELTKSWYCGLESTDWCRLVQDSVLVEAGAPDNNLTLDLQDAMTRAPREIGCGCRFKPFKYGASMVLEVTDKSQEGVLVQYTIRASIPPGPLSTEIQKVQRGWYRAGRKTTPQELYASIPIIHPKMHIVPGLPIAAVGRFPIVLAQKEAWPEICEKTWYMIAMTIAQQEKNRQEFPKVFALCNKKLQSHPDVPAQYAATYLHHPDERTVDKRTTVGFHAVPQLQPPSGMYYDLLGRLNEVPPPPPRPSQAPRQQEEPPPPPHGPPPPRFSLMTQDGPLGFEPDEVTFKRLPTDEVWEC
jgi:hypothetical protein